MYYDHILHILDFKNVEGLPSTKLKDYISLTGTPGIGKSVFYLYTIRKLWEECPDITIVTALFEKSVKWMSAVSFEAALPEVETSLLQYSKENVKKLRDGFEPPKIIFLYDILAIIKWSTSLAQMENGSIQCEMNLIITLYI